MNENIKEMLKKVVEDEALLAKMKKARDLDEAYSLACSIQDGYTKEEFLEAMQKLQTDSQYGELDDKDLVAAGGGTTGAMYTVFIVTHAATEAAIAGAAAA